VENVYIILKQIYSGNGLPNFIKIARLSKKILQERFWSFFLDTLYMPVMLIKQIKLENRMHY